MVGLEQMMQGEEYGVHGAEMEVGQLSGNFTNCLHSEKK